MQACLALIHFFYSKDFDFNRKYANILTYNGETRALYWGQIRIIQNLNVTKIPTGFIIFIHALYF